MKCPNCKNEIKVSAFRRKSVPANPNAKWYQFTNVILKGHDLITVPKNPGAKWYQYTDTKILCAHCNVELKIHGNLEWLRFIAFTWMIFALLSDIIFPFIKENIWVKIVLYVPAIIVFTVVYKANKYSIELVDTKKNGSEPSSP